MSEEIKHITCPNCGASLDYRVGDAVAYCVYCNTTTQLRETKETEEQFSLEVTVDRADLEKVLVGDLLKVPGTSSSLRDQFQIKEAKLVYVPYYVGQVHGTLEWSGLGRQARFYSPYRGGYRGIEFYTEPEQGIFDDHTTVIVYAGPKDIPDLDVIKEYKFATKGRRFFARGEIEREGGEVMDPIIAFQDGKQRIVSTLESKHKNLLMEELEVVQNVVPNYQVTQVQLIYVPLWFVKWTVSGSSKVYRAIVDAASGETLITDIPRTKSFWLTIGFVVFTYLLLAILPFVLPFVIFTNAAIQWGLAIIPLFLGGQTIYKVARTTFRERRK